MMNVRCYGKEFLDIPLELSDETEGEKTGVRMMCCCAEAGLGGVKSSKVMVWQRKVK